MTPVKLIIFIQEFIKKKHNWFEKNHALTLLQKSKLPHTQFFHHVMGIYTDKNIY